MQSALWCSVYNISILLWDVNIWYELTLGTNSWSLDHCSLLTSYKLLTQVRRSLNTQQSNYRNCGICEATTMIIYQIHQIHLFLLADMSGLDRNGSITNIKYSFLLKLDVHKIEWNDSLCISSVQTIKYSNELKLL